MMMRWYENLYVSQKASKEKLKQFGRMRKEFSFPAYVITLPANEQDLLDIISYQEFTSNPCYEDSFVIGIASGKADAKELVMDIIWDTYSHTGQFKVKEYLGLNL